MQSKSDITEKSQTALGCFLSLKTVLRSYWSVIQKHSFMTTVTESSLICQNVDHGSWRWVAEADVWIIDRRLTEFTLLVYTCIPPPYTGLWRRWLWTSPKDQDQNVSRPSQGKYQCEPHTAWHAVSECETCEPQALLQLIGKIRIHNKTLTEDKYKWFLVPLFYRHVYV